MSVWFDDLQEGMEFTSGGRTLTEADLTIFCGVSGDFHPLHTDAVHAAASPFGERLIHGALVLSVATGQRSGLEFLGDALVAFLEIRSWRFVKPVFVGDTLRTHTVITELHPTSRPGRGVVIQDVAVRNQRGEVVQEGQMVNLLRSRPETQKG